MCIFLKDIAEKRMHLTVDLMYPVSFIMFWWCCIKGLSLKKAYYQVRKQTYIAIIFLLAAAHCS